MGRRRGAADTSRKGVRISWRRSNQDASPHIIPGLQPGNTTLVEGCHASQTERWLFGKRRPTISWTLVLWACPPAPSGRVTMSAFLTTVGDTANVVVIGGGGACPCGVVFDRWVTPQDAGMDLVRPLLFPAPN
jgi:hypothetical protein